MSDDPHADFLHAEAEREGRAGTDGDVLIEGATAPVVSMKRPQDIAFRPERALVNSDRSEWIINNIEIEHRCGFCGEVFEISDKDPHWPGGVGPDCPMIRGLRHAAHTWRRAIFAWLSDGHSMSNVQAALRNSGIMPYGGSVVVLLLRRWMDGWEGDDDGVIFEVDAVIEDVLYACWTCS